MPQPLVIFGFFAIVGIIVTIVTIVVVGGFGAVASAGGGVLVSPDGGDSWAIIQASRGLKILSWERSIHDPSKIYFGTNGNGLWMMKNGGEEFKKIRDPGGILNDTSDIYAIAESPTRRGELWLAVFQENRGRVIRFRETEGGEELYFTPLERYGVFDIAVDPFDGNRVYFGAGDGGFFETRDGGKSWKLLRRFREGIVGLEEDPARNEHLWLFGSKKSIFITSDAGLTFSSIEDALKSFKGGKDIHDFLYDPRNETIWLGTEYGLLRSFDGGLSWRVPSGIISPDLLPVLAVALDPKDPNILWVSSRNQVYYSSNAGVSWRGQVLPVDRDILFLIVDAQNSNYIYAGFDR